ncbi:choice-of-anchor tandem repeat GloVer-containing protein [Aureispira anguillae]|uniref:T9SS type A sorting domain-containing protein n=1 Tax=Aureispira anguillae TaxID=2864201 RepID=A0A915YD10_9BACT|nr:choice-of-anchor tandem repeat GloVer-containing protein [Aureispira anguillae]BDS10819.1 T9SS type A sorting domain-containing protein [Aureispira anguillae]
MRLYSILSFVIYSTILFSTTTKAQKTYEYWGMTSHGSTDAGVIFKMEEHTTPFGQNIYAYTQSVVHTFEADAEGALRKGLLCEASNGKLYGMTQGGGIHEKGIIFEYDPNTKIVTKILDFNGYHMGAHPEGGLVQASNGLLYGMTYSGGIHNQGVAFKYNLTTGVFTKLKDFIGVQGSYPKGSFIEASNGLLYGMTSTGGTYSAGTIFKCNLSSDVCTIVEHLAAGTHPYGDLVDAGNGKLFGLTYNGGAYSRGTLFEYDLTTSTYTHKVAFSAGSLAPGHSPKGSLVLASNGNLYGVTFKGGIHNKGVLFEYSLPFGVYTKKIDFDGTNKGAFPAGRLVEASNGKLYGETPLGGTHDQGVIFEYDFTTNTYTKKRDLITNINSTHAIGPMTMASNGKIYAMTLEAGAHGKGILFSYDPIADTYAKEFDFGAATSGMAPHGSLTQASDGNLYGMTSAGGSQNKGVLFKFDLSSNTYIKQVDLDGNNGAVPLGSLLEANNGKLYGMTSAGGTNNVGVLFEYNPSNNTFLKKIDFNLANSNLGAVPKGNLMAASNGKLYGMTSRGGNNDKGIIFEYDIATNTLVKKLDFDGNNGASPQGSLLEADNGKLYGMTKYGGSNNVGVLFEYDLSTNTYRKIINYGQYDGKFPHGHLIQASNGRLYGMAQEGGFSLQGVLFEYDITSDTYLVKISFQSGTNWGGNYGSNPEGSLIENRNGTLFGMTTSGGNAGNSTDGIVFTYNTATSTMAKRHTFDSYTGAVPYGDITEVVITNVGVNLLPKAAAQIHTFPNPSADELTIDAPNLIIEAIHVLDYSGKRIKSYSPSKQLNITDLPAGAYLLQLETQKGQVSSPFIKQ